MVRLAWVIARIADTEPYRLFSTAELQASLASWRFHRSPRLAVVMSVEPELHAVKLTLMIHTKLRTND